MPTHGGMVSQINAEGVEIFKLDRTTLLFSPMTAGGMPLLFPFAGRVRDDSYYWKERLYHMPMHGLVKNEPFGIRELSDDRAILWMRANPTWHTLCYPFDFSIELDYRVRDSMLICTAAITNHSYQAMPHSLGWHPYFRASDRKRSRLMHTMKHHYNYHTYQDDDMVEISDLSLPWDEVFHTPGEKEIILVNHADGYEVQMLVDDSFQALVVCTTPQDSICVEPWCALPDAIHNHRFMQWIDPFQTRTHQIQMNIGRKL